MSPLNTPPRFPNCVAHVIRPADGGILSQVNTLIEGMPNLRSLAAAPEKVLSKLERIRTHDRLLLPNSHSIAKMLRAGISCGRWARVHNAELLHGHGLKWTPLFVAARICSRLPLVITLHNMPPTHCSPIESLLIRLLLSGAKRTIAVSQAIATSAKGMFGTAIGARIRVVRNGVDFTRLDILREASRAEARLRLGLEDIAPVAVCVARLSPEKNVGAFIQAAAQVLRRARFNNAVFMIAGDGPERSKLEAQICESSSSNGQIRLLGKRGDVPLLLQAADVICVPSLEEGLGLAPIEGMAAGLPVIATRVGGLPEVVVDRETGILVDGDTANGIATGLSELFGDPALRSRMGSAGRLRALSLFSSERMIAETLAVYAEATGR